MAALPLGDERVPAPHHAGAMGSSPKSASTGSWFCGSANASWRVESRRVCWKSPKARSCRVLVSGTSEVRKPVHPLGKAALDVIPLEADRRVPMLEQRTEPTAAGAIASTSERSQRLSRRVARAPRLDRCLAATAGADELAPSEAHGRRTQGREPISSPLSTRPGASAADEGGASAGVVRALSSGQPRRWPPCRSTRAGARSFPGARASRAGVARTTGPLPENDIGALACARAPRKSPTNRAVTGVDVLGIEPRTSRVRF